MLKFPLAFFCFLFVVFQASAQNPQPKFTRSDSLFGSNTLQRSWWDVQHYAITVEPDFDKKSITGRTTIVYKTLTDVHSDYLQIDLQKPMVVDSIFYNGHFYINYPAKPFYWEGDHLFIPLPKSKKDDLDSITIVYHGIPKQATMPPWDGGWVWSEDEQGRLWVSVACEGDGASVWYPCKDAWYDEPDSGASLTIIVPDSLVAVGNGRLTSKTVNAGKGIYTWEVKNPINTYNIIPYIGHYVSWSDSLAGEAGQLDLTYWVLDYELEKAKKQFQQVKPTIQAFEYWFGPYPFYRDGYQLVQAPYLGMEHQSAVAYGNGFENGYLGSDLSNTGWGLKWDYIIVHETGHEWFGNNITAADRADMWVHEGFTDYSETLFVEKYFGKEAGNEYTRGLRAGITNDKPIIAAYGVNKEGSGDMYAKGSNIIHTIRQIIANDERFRNILRGLNKEFRHSQVSTQQIENYINIQSGKQLNKIFDQYLRTTKIPVLQYKRVGKKVQYRWSNVISGFNMPVKLTSNKWISPGTKWQTLNLQTGEKFAVDNNFYITLKKL